MAMPVPDAVRGGSQGNERDPLKDIKLTDMIDKELSTYGVAPVPEVVSPGKTRGKYQCAEGLTTCGTYEDVKELFAGNEPVAPEQAGEYSEDRFEPMQPAPTTEQVPLRWYRCAATGEIRKVVQGDEPGDGWELFGSKQ